MSLLSCLCTLAQVWTTAPGLPAPVTNNAVAARSDGERVTVYSFLGLDSTKTWSGVTNRVFRWEVGTPSWEELRPVPGVGRLASTAQAIGDRLYVFGGYTVAEDGSERSLPNVDIYHPDTETWSRGAPIPVPVDDAVSGVWRDSLVYLVSGWHDRDNVADVQIYDPATDTWSQATPIRGQPVFGHTGAVAGNTIVYIDGVRRDDDGPRYVIESSTWRGDIDPTNPTVISWTRLAQHPGPALYRSAAVAVERWIVFAGGTDNPYNYSGIGYNGIPARARDAVWTLDTVSHEWRQGPSLPTPTMDHRGITLAGEHLIMFGGMAGNQQVTSGVVIARVEDVLPPAGRR
jgi:N-acetylneuraminic acid mutarotase